MHNSLTAAVLDSDPEYLKLYTEVLNMHGVEVISSSNDSSYSLDIISEKMPDFLIMDILIPAMDIFEFVDIVREVSPNTSILVGTLISDSYLMNTCIEKGVEIYIIKPFSTQKIIENLLKLTGFPNRLENIQDDVSDDIVKDILSELSLPFNNKGTKYIISSVSMMVNLHVPLESIHVTKEIYPDVARLYKTTESGVEKGIRYCIYSKFDKEFFNSFEDYENCVDCDGNYKCSNSKFLVHVANLVIDKLCEDNR